VKKPVAEIVILCCLFALAISLFLLNSWHKYQDGIGFYYVKKYGITDPGVWIPLLVVGILIVKSKMGGRK